MTMKSLYDTEITASLSARDDVVVINLNWDVITVSVEQFVEEVRAMNIPGLTINYEAPKAPLPTKQGVYADRQGDVWVISEDGEKPKIVACANYRWYERDGEPLPEGFAPFTLLVPKEES